MNSIARSGLALGPTALSLAFLSGCAARAMPGVNDAVAPTIRIVAPAEGARVTSSTPTIEIQYADDASGIQVVSFHALINGRDYSADFDHHIGGASGTISASRPLPLGVNHLVAEVADRAGNVGRVEGTFINAGGGWITAAAAPNAEPRRNVELILDASGSMADPLGLSTRMAVAKDAIKELVGSIPGGTPLGLRVFRDCNDISQLVAIQPVDKTAYDAQVEKIEPTRGTPLVAALLQSFDALGQTTDGQRVAVLVTDGGESCGGSLDEAVNRAKDAATRVVIIGFNIEDSGITAQLKGLAESTGGAFYDARDPDQLKAALERSVLRLTYSVYDATGKEVGQGDVGGDRLEFASGTYSIRFHTLPALGVDDVQVGSLTETTIELHRTPAGTVAEVRGPTPAAVPAGSGDR